jgi:hypothetical protein
MIAIIGRSSSHFTRTVRIFAAASEQRPGARDTAYRFDAA